MPFTSIHGPCYGPRFFPGRCGKPDAYVTNYEELFDSEADAWEAKLDCEAKITYPILRVCVVIPAAGSWNLGYAIVTVASQMPPEWHYSFPRTGEPIPGKVAPLPVAYPLAPSPSPTPAPSADWFTPPKLGSSTMGYPATTAGQWVDPNTGTPLSVRRLPDGSYENSSGKRVTQYGILA